MGQSFVSIDPMRRNCIRIKQRGFVILRMENTHIIKKIYNKYKKMSIPVKASLWFMVCSIIQRGMSFLTVPIFTRLLTTEQYGRVTVYTSWMGIICIFTTLNLQYGSFNTAQVKFEGRRDEYTSAIQSLATLMTGIAIIVYFFSPSVWQKVFGMSGDLILIMLFHILFQFSVGLWMGIKRYDFNYRPMVLETLLSTFTIPIVGIIVVLYSQDRGSARIVSMACCEIVFGCVIYCYNLFVGKKIYDKEYWKFALLFNVPLVPYYLSQIIFNTSDRIMISNLVGDDKAGIYGLAYSVAMILIFVISSINNAFVPWFYRQIKANDGRKLSIMSKELITGVAIMLLLFIALAPEIIMFMGGKEYYEAIWIVPPVTASLLFSFYTDFTCNIEFFFEKKGLLVAGTIMSAIVNIVLNYFGILYIGYFIAGYTTLFSYILFWIFLYVGAQKVCREHDLDESLFINFGFQSKVAVLFLAGAAFIMVTYLCRYIRYILLVLVFILAVIYRKRIIDYLQRVLKAKESEHVEEDLQ